MRRTDDAFLEAIYERRDAYEKKQREKRRRWLWKAPVLLCAALLCLILPWRYLEMGGLSSENNAEIDKNPEFMASQENVLDGNNGILGVPEDPEADVMTPTPVDVENASESLYKICALTIVLRSSENITENSTWHITEENQLATFGQMVLSWRGEAEEVPETEGFFGGEEEDTSSEKDFFMPGNPIYEFYVEEITGSTIQYTFDGVELYRENGDVIMLTQMQKDVIWQFMEQVMVP